MLPIRSLRSYLTVSVALCVLAVSLSGCATFRRKFIRQKKADKKEKIIPVLEPVTYQARSKTPQERYTKAYGMWKVWESEAEEDLNNTHYVNDKKSTETFKELIAQCQAMGGLLQEDKRQEMAKEVAMLQRMLKEFNKPESLRNYTRMKSNLRAHGRLIREQFNPEAATKFFSAPERE